jgi:catechol 2,3-dioxygenase
MLAKVSRIGHVGLAVADLDRSIRFYVDELGMQLTEKFVYPEEEVGHGTAVRAGAFVRLDSTHHCLSLFVLKDDADGRGTIGLHHLAFELPTPAALLELYRAFKARGIPIVNARKGGPGNQPRFYASDPDGNLLEFYWGIDDIGWDGQARAYDPIQEIDLEDFDFVGFGEVREAAARAAALG